MVETTMMDTVNSPSAIIALEMYLVFEKAIVPGDINGDVLFSRHKNHATDLTIRNRASTSGSFCLDLLQQLPA